MTYRITTTLKIAALAVSAAVSSGAFAQAAGSDIVSVGWFHFQPNDSSTPLTVTNPPVLANLVAQSGALNGSGATVQSTDTIGFSWTHFITTHWAGSLDLGIPPTYKLDGAGTLSGVGQIGQAKQWAPTVVGKYFFLGADRPVRPWLGLGFSHVSYKDISLTGNFQNTISGTMSELTGGALTATGTSASIDSKWVPVYNAGVSYAIDRKWYASLSLSYLPLKNTATLDTNSNFGPITSQTTIKIDPLVTYATIGYKF